MASTVNSGSANQKSCMLDSNLFDLGCLAPSLAIILALSFLEKRVQLRPDICGGRPALVIPVNFLSGSHSKRFSLAMAFGAIAGSCMTVFIGQASWAGFDSPWTKVFRGIVMVLMYGIICYPFFACLMTEYKMVGAVLGLIYTLMRFISLFVVIFGCTDISSTDILAVSNVTDFFAQLPIVLCHLVLIVKFAFLLWKGIRQTYWLNARDIRQTKVSTSACIAKENNTIYVRLLLRNELNQRCDSAINTLPWYIKLRKRFTYQRRPDFKFSTQVISTLVVAGIIVYELTVATTVFSPIVTILFRSMFGGSQRFWKVVTDCLYVSFTFSGILAITQMLNFLKCHREHVLTSYKTTLRQGMTPPRLVLRSLSFSGFQIAYIVWGVISMDIVLFIVSIIISAIDNVPEVRTWVEQRLLQFIPATKTTTAGSNSDPPSSTVSSLPLLFFSVLVWILQFLLAKFVFRTRQFPDVTVTIDNLRLFGVFSYLFFLFNILAGLFSAISRILKSMVLGLVFLPRIDRTPLMKGFENWDKAHQSYIGFINVLKAFNHPVMLVFCQLLLDRHHKDENVDDGVIIGKLPGEITEGSSDVEEGMSTYIVDKHARNRWFLAVTLMRNPGLAKYRKTKASMITEDASADAVEAVVF